jgi:hypothetical protein
MPIRKEMRSLYGADWKAISQRIRFERAQGRCEWCDAEHGKPHPTTGSIVVLTTAHIDQNPANSVDDNLAALCQRCHLRHDRPFHIINRRLTIRRRYALADLFPPTN